MAKDQKKRVKQPIDVNAVVERMKRNIALAKELTSPENVAKQLAESEAKMPGIREDLERRAGEAEAKGDIKQAKECRKLIDNLEKLLLSQRLGLARRKSEDSHLQKNG